MAKTGSLGTVYTMRASIPLIPGSLKPVMHNTMRCAALPLVLLVGACAIAERASPAASESPVERAQPMLEAEPSLLGSWRILAINGRLPVATAYGEPATLVFSPSGHGGNAGCNSFGGLGLQHEGRWYGGSSVSTQMACGSPREEQDSAVMGLLARAPALEWNGPDRVTLAGAGGGVLLARNGASPQETDLIDAPRSLLGTRWRFRSVDGTPLPVPNWREQPQLLLEGERYRLDTACLTAEGTWQQAAQNAARLDTPGVTATRACPEELQTGSRALLAALPGEKRYVTGPNGEIILAGGGHWFEGEGVRVGVAEAQLVVGRWRREDWRDATHPTSARPPELVLTERSFHLWNGCNATEGLAILFERQLITRGSGVSTLANCPPEQIDRQFAQVLGSQPRVGVLADGGLLLSSPAGELRLRKVGSVNPKDGGVRRTLGHPMRFALLDHGGGTLEITGPARYRLTLSCGVVEGSWRSHPRDPEGSSRFGPDREPEACQSAAPRALTDLFRGNVEVAIGSNRDIALFVSRFGSVAARLER